MSTISAFLSLFRSREDQPQINENEVWANVARAKTLAASCISGSTTKETAPPLPLTSSIVHEPINEGQLWARVAQQLEMYPDLGDNRSTQEAAERFVTEKIETRKPFHQSIGFFMEDDPWMWWSSYKPKGFRNN